MAIKICIAGATGWTGSCLAKQAWYDKNFTLTGAVSPSKSGRNLGHILSDDNIDITISGSVANALQTETDVMIDFTNPESVKDNVLTAVRNNVHVVIGTSGLTEDDYANIDREARNYQVGVLAAGNFAITAVLLGKFAEIAAKYVPSWEIIDYAGAEKPDAPSGTARELVHRLSKVAAPKIAHPIEKTLGVKETRGASMDGTQVHSLRLPGYVLSVDVIFGATDEKLVIRHEAGSSAEPYVQGALLAARSVDSFTGLKRGLNSVIEL